MNAESRLGINTYRVFLVQDNPDALVLWRQAMKLEGLLVVAIAKCGQTAINLVRDNNILGGEGANVAILDYYLGKGPTGADVGREIRKRQQSFPLVNGSGRSNAFKNEGFSPAVWNVDYPNIFEIIRLIKSNNLFL